MNVVEPQHTWVWAIEADKMHISVVPAVGAHTPEFESGALTEGLLRATAARAPQHDGHACSAFLVGILLQFNTVTLVDACVLSMHQCTFHTPSFRILSDNNLPRSPEKACFHVGYQLCETGHTSCRCQMVRFRHDHCSGAAACMQRRCSTDVVEQGRTRARELPLCGTDAAEGDSRRLSNSST